MKVRRHYRIRCSGPQICKKSGWRGHLGKRKSEILLGGREPEKIGGFEMCLDQLSDTLLLCWPEIQFLAVSFLTRDFEINFEILRCYPQRSRPDALIAHAHNLSISSRPKMPIVQVLFSVLS